MEERCGERGEVSAWVPRANAQGRVLIHTPTHPREHKANQTFTFFSGGIFFDQSDCSTLDQSMATSQKDPYIPSHAGYGHEGDKACGCGRWCCR